MLTLFTASGGRKSFHSSNRRETGPDDRFFFFYGQRLEPFHRLYYQIENDKTNEVPPKKDLVDILDGCKEGNAECQRELYELLYEYTLNICLRYAPEKGDAMEIMQDGFIKIFRKIGGFAYPSDADKLLPAFRSWVKKIMTYTAIDHHRKNKKLPREGGYQEIESITLYYVDNFGYAELIEMVRQLPVAYRCVFNLYVIDGYSHKEIAAMLKISESTSRSNLSKAKEHLRQFLKKTNEEAVAKCN